jgi:hypothetical protein
MSSIYEAIGRVVVWIVRVRYGRQIRIALGIALASILLGGYLAASRKMEEG